MESAACFSCFEQVSGSSYFACPESSQHSLCIECFTNYVAHCLSTYSVAKTIPISCSIPGCKYLVPEDVLKDLLVERSDLWDTYQSIQLKVALDSEKREVAYKCPKCDFLALINKAPPHYWKKIDSFSKEYSVINENDIKQRKTKKLMSLEEYFSKVIDEIEVNYQQQVTDYLETLQREEEEAANAIDEILATKSEAIFSLEKEKDDVEKLFWECVEKLHVIQFGEPLVEHTLSIENVKNIVDSCLNTKIDYDVLLLSSEELDGEALETNLKMNIAVSNQEISRLIECIDEETLQKERVCQEKIEELMATSQAKEIEKDRFIEELSVKRLEDLRRARAEEEEFIQNVEEFYPIIVATKDTIMQNGAVRAKLAKYLTDFPEKAEDCTLFDVVSLDQVDATFTPTEHFDCQAENCRCVVCLRCSSQLTADEVAQHVCPENAVEDLYNEVLEVLAKASSRSCPKCGYAGLKDLACTHICCPKCRTAWCYYCGAGVKTFQNHNGKEGCPTFLERAFNGLNARQALVQFHRNFEVKAIEELKKKVEPELWEEMLRMKFPNGIFE